MAASPARRGDVWWVDFGPPRGSAPGLRRPALIVSADEFNGSRIGTVLVAAITSRLDRAKAPGNVRLDRGVAGLPKASVVNVSQLYTLDRDELASHVGRIPPGTMKHVDLGLLRVLGLPLAGAGGD